MRHPVAVLTAVAILAAIVIVLWGFGHPGPPCSPDFVIQGRGCP